MRAPAIDATLVNGLPLFRDLKAEDLDTITASLRSRTFPNGSHVMTVDQPGEAVYIILSGTVKVHVEQVDGTNVILALLGPGQIVGEMSVTDQVGRSASVVTLEECHLLWIDRFTFDGYIDEIPAFARNLTRILSNRLRQANNHIQALAALDVYGRVARQVLSLGEEYGETKTNGDIHVPVRLTQGDLADLVGASRVRVNQVLVDFKQRGYLTVDSSHHVTIHDPIALRRRIS